MAMRSSTLRGRFLSFGTSALSPNPLELISFHGMEALSQPYKFDLEFLSSKAEIDTTALLLQPSYLTIKQGVAIKGKTRRGVRSLKIHGVLLSIEA